MQAKKERLHQVRLIALLLFLQLFMSNCDGNSTIDRESKSFKNGFSKGAKLGQYHPLVPDPARVADLACTKIPKSRAFQEGCKEGYLAAYKKTGGLVKPVTINQNHYYGPDDGYTYPTIPIIN